MVRMYSIDMRCSLCLHPGSFGWVYRCSQDRELMIGNAYNEGGVNGLDSLFDSFTVPAEPKRRSAAARVRPVSFLEEMGPGQLQAYSPQQLSILLDQRTHVLDVAKRHSRDLEIYRHREQSVLSPYSDLGNASDESKLWVPKPNEECQFKVCHRCRQACGERSFLSLDAIANDEIPMTAISGFGFNILGKRPVVPRKCAINYGLRPDPRPQMVFRPVAKGKGLGINIVKTPHDQLSEQVSIQLSPFDDEPGADTTFGQSSNAYDSSAMARSLNLESDIEITPIEPDERYALRRVLHVNMILAAETAKADAVEGSSLLSHIRAADTPPNSPRLRAAKMDDKQGKRPAVLRGRSDNSLHTNAELRRKFNLDDVEGDEEDDITYILRKRRFYLASDAQSDSKEEEDGKSTSEFATTMEVEDRDAEGSTAKPVVVTRRTVGIQLSDVVTQI
ncbi:hypothetical protein VE01_01848 [Pseudogymnoascus verrucosus]|uniref:Uncharacterized protein n=1 Tax=Pseudogymnoascus verrucosus TaxID=342668 RepID=A0A1B8GWI9_9PEZI|nr:uncharacterized protein VE01_01848 [Pseudogymnoascus verrucosus]OBU00196.1 hypothetical protein VE01_01848 [Pseudogymnoascus verrucosus]